MRKSRPSEDAGSTGLLIHQASSLIVPYAYGTVKYIGSESCVSMRAARPRPEWGAERTLEGVCEGLKAPDLGQDPVVQ